MANGHQRYRCNACRRSFTATPPRGKPPAMKALAVLLYALGNVSQGMIAKLLGVSHVAVYKWVRAAGEEAPAPSTSPEDNIVQIDEMWHFVDGKKTRFGSGEPLILWHGEPWPGSWAGVMTRPAGDFSTRSASTATSSSLTTGRVSTGSSRRKDCSPARTCPSRSSRTTATSATPSPASGAAPRSPRAPATWSTAPSGCSATCGGPGTSCRCATTSYLSLPKCLEYRTVKYRDLTHGGGSNDRAEAPEQRTTFLRCFSLNRSLAVLWSCNQLSLRNNQHNYLSWTLRIRLT